MRIGVDARVLDRRMTGTGRYLLNLLKELPNQDSENEYYLFTGSDLAVDKDFYKIIKYKKSVIPFKVYSPYWLNILLPKLLKENKIDILFSPNILTPIVDLPETKIVSVVHDVIPWVYPEYYPYFYKKYLSFFVPRSLRKTDIVVTVSEHSKNDLINYFSLPENKLEVVYNTAADKFKSMDTTEIDHVKSTLDLPDKYLLYVGVVEPRKNVMGLIEIIEELRKRGSALKLVIVGRPGFSNQLILKEIEKRKDLITHIHFLDDDKLTYAFRNAFAFIFPSYYEGFGIPPLEAMQCGVPVLSSNASSLSEVVENGGMLRAPDDHLGFVEDVLKLENSNDFYNLMKSKAIEQAKKFDIGDNTRKLVSIFNELGK